MTVLIGMAGLGTGIPYLTCKHRQVKPAALSAAVVLTKGHAANATEAKGIAAVSGFSRYWPDSEGRRGQDAAR